MAESNITRFIRELSEDPEKAVAFEHDPHKVMDEAGLTDAEKDIVLSGDEELIARAVAVDYDAIALRRFVFRIRNIRFGV